MVWNIAQIVLIALTLFFAWRGWVVMRTDIPAKEAALMNRLRGREPFGTVIGYIIGRFNAIPVKVAIYPKAGKRAKLLSLLGRDACVTRITVSIKSAPKVEETKLKEIAKGLKAEGVIWLGQSPTDCQFMELVFDGSNPVLCESRLVEVLPKIVNEFTP